MWTTTTIFVENISLIITHLHLNPYDILYFCLWGANTVDRWWIRTRNWNALWPLKYKLAFSATLATRILNPLRTKLKRCKLLKKRFDKVEKVIIVVAENKQSRRGRTTARFNTKQSRRKIAPYVCFKINRSPTLEQSSPQINGFL